MRKEKVTLQWMTNALAPRGPDAEGIWLSPHVGLGHRRLAVVDPEGGAQPMAIAQLNETAQLNDRGYVLTYSGEIYNFPALREQLRGHGHHFRTRSDTEVLLHAYAEWGASCVERLNGMFAFAVWDAQAQELVLARDRLGIKPLFYSKYEGGLLFGSEVKALLHSGQLTAEVDVEGLAEIFCMTQTPGHAVYRNVRALPPGCIARVNRSGCQEHRYWQLESQPHTDDAPTTVRTVRTMLESIVGNQLLADVPVGAMLSGGVDSSALTGLASTILSAQGAGPISTYSAHFAGSEEHFAPSLARPDLDTPFARMMAEHVGADHVEVVLRTEDVFAALDEVVLAKDLPAFADINAGQLLLFREAKRTSTVVLSGESADEVFGGYPWFYHPPLLNMPSFPWANTDLLPVMSGLFNDQVRPHEYIANRYAEALAEVPSLPGEDAHDARVREMFYLNLTRWLSMLLEHKDRMSMRVGLEARVPYCDHELVQYVWNIPWHIKAMGDQPKGLLRTATQDLLPEIVRNRPKTAFPIALDPLYDKEARTRLRDELADPHSALVDLVDRHAVEELLGAAPTNQEVWRPVERIARLLQVGYWLRTYRVRIR